MSERYSRRECERCGIVPGLGQITCPICDRYVPDNYIKGHLRYLSTIDEDKPKKEGIEPNAEIINSLKELNETLKSIKESLSVISSCVDKEAKLSSGGGIPLLRTHNWGN